MQIPDSFQLKGKLWYVGLEAYESRYTLQLTDWNVRAFDALGVDYELVNSLVPPDAEASGKINVGQVLDAAGRPVHAMGQVQTLMRLLGQGAIKGEDTIFFEDMFHPGIESLPYLLDQIPADARPRIFVRCLAQTIDPDDFVHTTKMARWMRHTEQAVLNFVTGVFVASHEMLAHMTVAGWKCKAVVTGLPFDMTEVRSRIGYDWEFDGLHHDQYTKEWSWARQPNVVFAARADQEKQPEFFLEVAKRWRKWYSHLNAKVKFIIASGKPLTSNNPSVLAAIRDCADRGDIEVRENLTKNDYYKLLSESRVLFNCALQDWVSNTVSEADALGCNVLYPAYRSFPEAFNSDETRLYIPWSMRDAEVKLGRLLARPHPLIGQIAKTQSQTIWKTLSAIANWDDASFQDQIVDPTDTSYRPRLNRQTWDMAHHDALPDWWRFSDAAEQEIIP